MRLGARSSREEGGVRSDSDQATSAETTEREPADAQAPPVDGTEAGGVAGERGTASVNRVRSLQSRLSNVLAAGLMCALGIGALTWYYAHMFAQGAHRGEVAQRAAARQAAGDAPLPPLGPFSSPRAGAATAIVAPPRTVAQQLLGPPPELPSPAETAAWSQADRLARFGAATPSPPAAHSPQARTSAFDRELKGPVFAESSGPGSSGDGATAISI